MQRLNDDYLNGLHRHHARDRIDAIIQEGFEFWFEIDEEGYKGPRKDLIVRVQINDQPVAQATFVEASTEAHCDNVAIDEAFQRLGVGTALYIFAECVFGRPLSNFWGDCAYQSDSAKAFWANPNRLFGRPLDWIARPVEPVINGRTAE